MTHGIANYSITFLLNFFSVCSFLFKYTLQKSVVPYHLESNVFQIFCERRLCLLTTCLWWKPQKYTWGKNQFITFSTTFSFFLKSFQLYWASLQFETHFKISDSILSYIYALCLITLFDDFSEHPIFKKCPKAEWRFFKIKCTDYFCNRH